MQQVEQVLKNALTQADFRKLAELANPAVSRFVAEAIELCRPASVLVCSDTPEEIAAIRQMAIDLGEETPLSTAGHTYHFEGIDDQGRDTTATRYLVPEGMPFEANINSTPRAQGLEEMRGLLAGQMQGRTMLVRFFCLCPTHGPFSLPCLQITDSAYVAHSEDILYRGGYRQFRDLGGSDRFFRFLHSAGRLVNHVSADTDKRRIYIDLQEDVVYAVNTQYAGNTVGLKKLALRLAIRKADREGWLSEHMFIMGVHGDDGHTTYFTGAFPSACGKTSTAMLPGESIIGDDIAYFRIIGGRMRAANVESGIFGIIQEVNPKDDPAIYNTLTSPGEVIFSNVMISGGRPYWSGMGCALPASGVNYAGPWSAGKTNGDGKPLDPSHKNARYTVRLASLANLDAKANDPDGVPVSGIIYGGRDSDTSVPVQESFNWAHGIVTMGASLESETTAAVLGAQGVRKFNPMSNLDFLSIPIGKYIQNNLDFGALVDEPPKIFAVNYFLKDDGGKYLNAILDKKVWLHWMERRVYGAAEVVRTPTGLIPTYEDLRELFAHLLHKEYAEADYVRQFTVRIPELLAKTDRILDIYAHTVADTPAMVVAELMAQRERLVELRRTHGDYVSPLDLH